MAYVETMCPGCRADLQNAPPVAHTHPSDGAHRHELHGEAFDPPCCRKEDDAKPGLGHLFGPCEDPACCPKEGGDAQ